MAKFDYRELSPKDRRAELQNLAKLLGAFKNEKQLVFVLQRLLTPSEIVMIMRRFHAAQLLLQGRSYEKIQEQLSIGKSTIREVDRWLTDVAHEYQEIRTENKAQEGAKETEQRQRARHHKQLGAFGSLSHLMRRDSRFILLSLLLGDF